MKSSRSTSTLEALTSFLNSDQPWPSATGYGKVIQALMETLNTAGSDGLPYQEAIKRSSLPLPAFLEALGQATSAGVVEPFFDDGIQKLRLTTSGRSLL